MLRRTGPVPKTHSTLSFHSTTARTHHCSTPLYKALLTHSQALWLLLPNHQPSWFTEPHNSQPKLSSAHIKFRAAGYSQAVSFLQIKDPNLNLCVRYSMWVSTLQAHWHRETAMIWEMLRGGGLTNENTEPEQLQIWVSSEYLRPQWLTRRVSSLPSTWNLRIWILSPSSVNPRSITLERQSKSEWLFSSPYFDMWEIVMLRKKLKE